MKRRFTKLMAALALLVALAIPLGVWGQTRDLTQVVSFSRSGNNDSYTQGQTFSCVASGQSGYYQDGNTGADEKYLQLLGTTAYWTTTPSNISFTAKLGGGSAKDPLDNNVYVSLLDSNGDVISGTTTVVTTKITNKTGSDFTVSITPVNNVYGVKISHVKESGYNVRYYSFSLSYEAGGSSTGSITLDSYSVSVDYNEYYEEVGLSYEGITSPEFDLAYYESDGETPATYSWMEGSYVSYDYQSSGYKVYCIFEGNDGGTRYAYFKVYSGTVESELVTVTQGANPGIPTTTTIEPNSGFSNDLNNNPGGLLVATVTANSQTIQDPELTWASSNTSVATVNENGLVTLVAVGETDITATYAGDGTYAGSVGTYQLTVINTAPSVTVTPAYLNSFSYVVDHGPSAAQTISVEGANLSGNVTIEFDFGQNSNFEISQDGITWTSSIVLTPNGGVVASTSISVRLKADLNSGTAYGDVLRVKYNGSNWANFELNGSVTEITTMTVAQARAAIDAAIAQGEPYPQGVYVSGIVTRRYNDYLNNGQISYYISDNGTQTAELEAFRGKGLNNTDFENIDDIQAGDIVVVYGNLTKWGDTYELAEGNYLFSWERPVPVPAINANDMNMAYSDTHGELAYTIGNPTTGINLTATCTANWISNITVYADKVAFDATQNDGTIARTATFTLKYEGADDKIVHVTQGVYTPSPAGYEWVLTPLTSLNEDDVIVIVGDNGATYAMSNDQGTSKAPSAVSVTIENGKITSNVGDNIQWIFGGNATNGYTFNKSTGTNATWLYCTNTNDGLRVGTSADKTFTYVEGGVVGEVQQSYYLYNIGKERYIGIYNSKDWRCYTSINNNIKDQSFSFYKRVESQPDDYTKDIEAYTPNAKDKYYLIASPVECAMPAAENSGFFPTGATYDLYRFDQTQAEEWRNYKQETFNLISGHGYLYACSTATTLHFKGTTYSGSGMVTLRNSGNGNLAGWNLIGNPYDDEAFLQDANNGNRAYYKMNTAGTELEPVNNGTAIAAMEGVFVYTETDGETVTFVPSNTGNGDAVSQLSINVSKSRGEFIDRAFVRFDNGNQLPKFQLNPKHTKVYFQQDNKDYAVVRSANEGEMPVNFKAENNGTYTLSVNTENVEMTYLHLIDNKTGADVDLLQTPSYTFEAKTSDYASRFRLVFNANNTDEDGASTGSATFAYFNGSNWTVSNMGEATLQVVDVMGRVLSSETLSGNAEVSINQPTGVYMLRLVSGDSVKVQKVVVR